MILLIDNFDSFTYNLVDYLNQLGLQVKVQRNNVPLSELVKIKYTGVVLSPGPGTPDKAGNLMQVVDYYQKCLPILGICLGHQAIGEYFGGKLVKAQKPMHGKISTIFHSGDPLFAHIASKFEVVRYHSLICSDIDENLVLLAKTEDGEAMAMRHKQLPIYGLQFHPEAVLTQFGLQILRNWQNINSICN